MNSKPEAEFFQKLVQSIGNRNYLGEQVILEAETPTLAIDEFKFTFDFTIKTTDRIICLLEFRTNLDDQFRRAVNPLDPRFFYSGKCRFLAITDGKIFRIVDRLRDLETSVLNGLEEFLKYILAPSMQKEIDSIKRKACEIIIEKVNKYYPDHNSLKAHAAEAFSNIKLSRRYELFFEGSKLDDQSFENKFFLLLMNNGENLIAIYRYTSLSSIFETAKNKTIRMNGLAGMNDTTEANYVDNYLKETDLNLHEELPQTIAAINKRFILCCTELNDELLQWRLYGDDSKGVCIEFKINRNLLIQRNDLGKHDFYLGKVKYADSDHKHHELELIKEIIDEVRKTLHVEIRFTMLYVWKHFFKPYEYAYEKEVRLLYIVRDKAKKKWLLTNSHTIINPFVEFTLSNKEFPLKISEIKLGSKLPERQLNRAQFKQFLTEQGLKIDVNHSEIKNYR
jgi:hypothetical protein